MKPSAQLLSLLPLTRSAGALLGESAQQQQPLISQPQNTAAAHDGSSSTTSSGLPFATAAFEAYVEDVMEKWHTPGLAISIVNGDETWAKVSE